MDYHSDRFIDSSLMFFDDNQLCAVFPANRIDDHLYSHQGLTYGGFITDTSMTIVRLIECFQLLIQYMKDSQINQLTYKTIPYIYHKYLADEDLYALFRNSATLIRRDISSAVIPASELAFSDRRKRGIKKALKSNIYTKELSNLEEFYSILADGLEEKYNVKPTHSLDELKLLHERFPLNIRLFGASNETKKLLAAVLIYETENVAHAQYISSSNLGKEHGALDLLFNHLINNVYKNKKYFDFGISTEKQGLILNEGLINQKEGFGARAITYDFYNIDLNKLKNL